MSSSSSSRRPLLLFLPLLSCHRQPPMEDHFISQLIYILLYIHHNIAARAELHFFCVFLILGLSFCEPSLDIYTLAEHRQRMVCLVCACHCAGCTWGRKALTLSFNPVACHPNPIYNSWSVSSPCLPAWKPCHPSKNRPSVSRFVRTALLTFCRLGYSFELSVVPVDSLTV